MSQARITRADVIRALRQHLHALQSSGIAVESLTIQQEGSRTYGYQWRIVTETGARPPVGRSELGFTAREAYDEITKRTECVWNMRDALGAIGHTFPHCDTTPVALADAKARASLAKDVPS